MLHIFLYFLRLRTDSGSELTRIYALTFIIIFHIFQNLVIRRSRFFSKYKRYAIEFVKTFFICPYIHNNENTSWSTSMKILSDGSLVAAKIRNLSIKFIKNGLTILLVVIFELILLFVQRLVQDLDIYFYTQDIIVITQLDPKLRV